MADEDKSTTPAAGAGAPAPAATDAGAPAGAPAADADADVLKGAENPDAVKRALDRERESAKVARKEAEEAKARVKEFEDRDKSAQEKAEEAEAEAKRRASDAEQKALRYEVAAAKGVPLKQAHRLQGTSKEELEADADEFLKDVKGDAAPASFDGGARGRAPGGQDMDSLIRGAAGRN